MTFYLDYEEQPDWDFDIKKQFELVAEAVLDEEHCPFETEINLSLINDEEMKDLNQRMRNIDRTTDVLSFPMAVFEQPADFEQIEAQSDVFNPDTGELCLGDIAISVQRIEEQAKAYGHSVLREFSFLIAHSVLHLVGYDHIKNEDASVMEAKQKEILDQLKIMR
ncbi:MAG: rRNA maturation RNase YbeY [Clostridia bacterium]|nr:rRNA maturation RNase YbeY [Clostridia bacterium]